MGYTSSYELFNKKNGFISDYFERRIFFLPVCLVYSCVNLMISVKYKDEYKDEYKERINMINIKRFVVASSVLFIASVFCLPLAMALDPAPGFVGSDRCALCHSDKADRWRTTLHSSIYRSPDPANVISDFTGEVTLSDASKGIPETTFTLDNNGGNGPFTVTVKGETFVVDRAHGGRALDRNEDPRSPGVAGHSEVYPIVKTNFHLF